MEPGSPADRTPAVTSAPRIGDTERDQAAAALSEHFAAGRIDRDEFDVRLQLAYEARTRLDLQPLFADLPAPVPVLHPQRAGRDLARPARRRTWRPAYLLVPFLVVVGAITVVESLVGPGPGRPPLFVIPLLWFVVLRGSWGRRRRGW
jgi:hypothetical protein